MIRLNVNNWGESTTNGKIIDGGIPRE